MTKLLLLAMLVAGCAKEEPKPAAHVSGLSAAEIQRARDACRAYADAACRCTGSAGAQQCALARPLPDALEMAIQTAEYPSDQAGEDPTTQPRAEVLVRETVKECVEELAKLPALGCR